MVAVRLLSEHDIAVQKIIHGQARGRTYRKRDTGPGHWRHRQQQGIRQIVHPGTEISTEKV